jgi:uncharacterized membrane protein
MTGSDERVYDSGDLRRWDASAFVAAPRQRVYDYLADPRNRPEWQASLRRVEVRDEGPPRVGTRWVDHVYGAPPFHLRITAMRAGELWAEIGSSGPFTAYGSLLFEDAERDGVAGTAVRCIARVRGRGAARPLGPFAMAVAGVLVRNDLARAARILSRPEGQGV